MKKITIDLIEQVCAEAKQSARKRKNYNFHESMDETLHRMLNAIEPGTYIRPHKHELPDKAESFIVLRGKVLSVTFTHTGEILDCMLIDPQTGNFGVDIAPRIWHTVISLESGSIFYEAKDGPWQAFNDKNFAPWAPAEGDADAPEYLEKLTGEVLKRLGIK